MKVSDALGSVSRLYFDAAPLVYYVEESPAYLGKMDAIQMVTALEQFAAIAGDLGVEVVE